MSTIKNGKFGSQRRAFDPTVPLNNIPWLALDVETTGLDVARGHRVWEVAVLDEFGGSLVTTVLPSGPRPRGRALRRGAQPSSPSFSDIAKELRSILQRGVLVGHNVIFDLRFLHAEFRRVPMPFPEVWFVDTLSIARRLGFGGTLAELSQLLGVCFEKEELHRAEADARIAREVLEGLIAAGNFSTLADVWPQRFRFEEFLC